MLEEKADYMTEAEIDEYYDRKREEDLKQYYALQANRAIKQDQKSLMRLAVVMLVVVVVCTVFLKLNFQVQQKIYRTSMLQYEIDRLRLQNEDTKRRAEDLTDLHAVQERAQELGMDYPDAEQVIYYQMDDHDYMYQQHEIPQ